jgi:uncharacterized protein (TIGR02246 family)
VTFAELLQSYAARFDARDARGFAELFTADATIVTPLGKDLVGRERIVNMIERTPPGGEHRIGVPEVTQQDESSATTRTPFSATLADGTAVTGTYENTFARNGGDWLISRHVIAFDR